MRGGDGSELEGGGVTAKMRQLLGNEDDWTKKGGSGEEIARRSLKAAEID